jgi:hypothetical protein
MSQCYNDTIYYLRSSNVFFINLKADKINK